RNSVQPQERVDVSFPRIDKPDSDNISATNCQKGSIVLNHTKDLPAEVRHSPSGVMGIRPYSDLMTPYFNHFLPVKIGHHPPIVKGESFPSFIVTCGAANLNQGSIQCSGSDKIGGKATTGSEGSPFDVVCDGVPLVGNGQYSTLYLDRAGGILVLRLIRHKDAVRWGE